MRFWPYKIQVWDIVWTKELACIDQWGEGGAWMDATTRPRQPELGAKVNKCKPFTICGVTFECFSCCDSRQLIATVSKKINILYYIILLLLLVIALRMIPADLQLSWSSIWCTLLMCYFRLGKPTRLPAWIGHFLVTSRWTISWQWFNVSKSPQCRLLR